MSITTNQIKGQNADGLAPGKDWVFLFLSLCCLLLPFPSTAQSWFHGYPAISESNAILATPDGGYLLTGRTGVPNITAADDAFLLKLDVDGKAQWFQQYGGAEREDARDMVFSNDGGIVAVGSSNSFSQGADIFVFKADKQGHELWQKNYGPDNSTERANSIHTTDDGGYIITGCISCFSNPEVYLIKLDKDGDEDWSTTFDQAVEGMAVEALPDGYLIASVTNNTSIDFLAQLVLIKTDLNGNLLWTQSYGSTTDSMDVRAILALSDGLLFTGARKQQGQNKPDAYLFKTDFNGDSLWIHSYGDAVEGENVFDFARSPDNTITTTGITFQNGNGDYFFLKTDLDGNELSFDSFGGPAEETGKGIIINPDGSFTVTGIQRTFNGNQITRSDGLLVHSSPQGDIVNGVIQGRVFLDLNNTCSDDAEEGSNDWIVVAEGLSDSYYARPDSNGFYEIQVNTGTYNLSIFGVDNWRSCQQNINVSLTNSLDTSTVNFPMQVQYDCAVLQVDLATASLVRCVDNRFTVRYCNRGTDTATGAYLELQLPEEISISSAALPFTNLGNQRYHFLLGDLEAGYCNSIDLQLLLDCNSTSANETYCIDAQIFPQTTCLPILPTWDNSSLEVKATCVNDTVKVTLNNKGSGGMTKAQQVIIIEDQIVSRTTRIQLAPGELMAMPLVPFGQTVRITAEQAEAHPGHSRPTIAVEGCGTNSLGDFSRGYVNQFAEDDADLFIAKDCRESVDLISINNKYAFPKGRGLNHQIPTNTDIEYLLTFYNETSDTIRRVIIRDSLSDKLDLSGLEMGAASHAFNLEVLYTGWIKITFDSLTLLPGESGFAQYRLPQLADNTPGSLIQNKTEFILDDHPAFTSDRIFHTVGRTEIYETLAVDICEDDDFLGTSIRQDTVLNDTTTLAFSDSIRIFIIDHIPVEIDIQQVDICEGDSLFIGTSIYTQSGIYLDSLSYFTYDCDSLILATELHILEVERIINDTLIRRGEYFNNILILQDTTVIDTLTGNNGCDSLSILNITTTTVSTSADPITDFNVRLFPNPVQQELKIQLEGDVPPTIHLRLLNLHGKILQMFEAKNQRELSFSMHGIPVGIYLLELKGKDFYKTYRIIKKAK